MIRRPPRSTLDRSSAASDVYKRQGMALVEAVGQRGGGGLVDDAVDRQSGDLAGLLGGCLLYTSPSPRDRTRSRMPSSA